MNYKLTVVPLALSAALYLNGCGGQSNYTPEKMIEKPKMKYKLNVSAMEGVTIKVGDIPYTPNMELLEGTHTMIISKDGYENEALSLNLDSDKNITAKLKKAFQFEGNIIWESDNDTIPNYFKLSAEDNLLIALPPKVDVTAKGIYITSSVDNNKDNPEKVFLRESQGGTETYDAITNGFKTTMVFDSKNFSIGGMKGWSLPSTDNFLNKKIYTYHLNHSLGCENTKYNKLQCTHFRNNNFETMNHFSGYWRGEGYKYSAGLFSAVKPISDAQRTAFQGVSNHSLDTKSKIKHYAKIATNAQLRAKLRHVPMYSTIDFPQIPMLSKGEFETTVDFEKRQAKAIAEWEQTKKNIETKNLRNKERYDNEIEKAKMEFEEEEKLFADENYRNKIYKEFINEASGLFLGNPTFQDISYDADRAKMKATIVSSNDTSFKQTVEFDISLANAKQTKENILAKKLIPHITLNNNLDIESFKAVNNDTKISMEFEFANSKHTIKAYEEFIDKYPNSSFVKSANNGIRQVKEAEKLAQMKKQKEIELQEKEYAEIRKREQALYDEKKSVGDKVCTYSGFLAFKTKGYVEKVSGNKIQIKITDQGGTTFLNGNKIYVNDYIWDNANSWRKCD